MKSLFLNRLYGAPGPVASVYLDTSRDIDDPDRAIELRWRHLRERLLAHDADRATLRAIDRVVGRVTGRGGEVPGRHGLAVFGSAGRILLDERLPDPPPRDTARYGALPDALPLLLQRAPDIPYAAVLLHRVHLPDGAGGGDELEIDHDTGRWPRNRVNSTAVHRRLPLADWAVEAERFAGGLARNADGAELIVVAGDPWAANTLLRAVPRHLRSRFVRLRHVGHHRPEPGRAVLEDEVGRLLADRSAGPDQRRIDAFLAERSRDRDATEGLARTVAALQRGQAAALLVNRPLPPLPPLWAGAAPTDLALNPAELRLFGVGYFWEEPADTALLRAAVGTGADLVVVPLARVALPDGVAVLPRYREGRTHRVGTPTASSASPG